MIVTGDCLTEMRKMEANSISCIVTDPPYFLINNSGSGFMGKSWDSIQGLSKYLWLNDSFVSFAITLLNGLQVEKIMAGQNIALLNASIKPSESERSHQENAPFVENHSLSLPVQKSDSVHLLVLTRGEVLGWLKELSPNHTQMLERSLSGETEDALFVLPISLLASVVNAIAPKSVSLKLRVKDIEVREILLSSMDLAEIKNAIEVMIGTRCAKIFTEEIIGHVDIAEKNAKEKRFNVITLSHIEKGELTTWITSLLCVINATSKSSTIPNFLITNFYLQVFREAYRICKPGSHVLAFGGSRSYHLLASGIEQAGFEVRDCIMYCYGSGFPKSHNFGRKLGGDWSGYGTALKPAHEPIIVCMKPLEGTFAQNAEKWGVAGINIDACRIPTETDLGRNNLVSAAWGTYGNGPSSQYGKPIESQGRWPANLILDEEAGEALDEMSGVSKSSNCPRKKGKSIHCFGQYNEFTSDANHLNDSGGASRFFYCAKASKSERNQGLEGFEDKIGGGMSSTVSGDTRSGHITVQKNNHPTVKPLKLMEYLIKLVMPPKDGILLDPFAGSGSTIVAAKRLEVNAIGIEMSEEYSEIAKARLASAQRYVDKQNAQLKLPFPEEKTA